MGDRANIRFTDSTWKADTPVTLYSHSYGYDIHNVAAIGIKAAVGAGRANDGIYATRIAVQAILTEKNPDQGELGWGLSGAVGDGEYNILVVDWGTQTVWRLKPTKSEPVPFDKFVADPTSVGTASD